MRKFSAFLGASLAVLALSGCGSSGSIGQQTVDVVGKVQTQPYFSEMSGPDGDFCSGVPISQTFSGQQVKLLDAEGKIVGVTKLEGWDGEGARAEAEHLIDTFGYNDGDMCSWDFTFPGVSLTSDFYTLEFSDKRVTPPTITKEDLMTGPVVVIG
jgi:hypothetical protein